MRLPILPYHLILYNLLHMVVGFGLSVVDLLAVVDGPIVLNYKNLLSTQLLQVGGVVPTALMTLAVLGVKTKINTALGDDHFADEIIDILKNHHVGIGQILHIPDTMTPVSVIVVTKQNGHRTGFNSPGAFPNIKPIDISVSLSRETAFVMLDGHNPACSEKFLRAAKKEGIRTVFDFGNPKPGMEALMREADLVVVPTAYWKSVWPALSPRDIAKQLVSHEKQTVVLTMEEEGCVVGTKTEILHQSAPRVKEVDTNGAGDIFLGVFTYGLLKKWTLQKTAECACRLASLSCGEVGKDKKLQTIKGLISTL